MYNNSMGQTWRDKVTSTVNYKGNRHKLIEARWAGALGSMASKPTAILGIYSVPHIKGIYQNNITPK